MTTSHKLWHIHCESTKDATKVLPVTLLIAGWFSQIFLQQTGVTDAWSEPWSKHAFLYLTFLIPPPSPAFSDQSAFQPVGFTSAGTISVLHTVSHVMQFNPLVVLSRCTFPKRLTPSDTPRACWLNSTCRRLSTTGWTFSAATRTIPCSVETSRAREASSASTTQGSSIGSATYTVTAADLRPLNPDNIFIKFADDIHFVISVPNISTRAAEIDNIAASAAENNLKLN